MYDDMCIIVTSAATSRHEGKEPHMTTNIETIAYRNHYGTLSQYGTFDKVDSEDDE